MRDTLPKGYELIVDRDRVSPERPVMTCYLKHLGWLFRVLELDNDAGNRHRIDRGIKDALGLPHDAPCEDVEAYLAALSGEERFELIDTLERVLAG